MKLQAEVFFTASNNRYAITVREEGNKDLIATHYCDNYKVFDELNGDNNIGICLMSNNYITSAIWVNSITTYDI